MLFVSLLPLMLMNKDYQRLPMPLIGQQLAAYKVSSNNPHGFSFERYSYSGETRSNLQWLWKMDW